jgi:hypothetical protein
MVEKRAVEERAVEEREGRMAGIRTAVERREERVARGIRRIR